MDLGLLDFIILIVIIACAIGGAFKGFISQLVGIVSLVLGIWSASKFTPYVTEQLKSLIPAGETVIYIVAFLTILLVVMLLCTFIGKGIEKIVHFTLLGWLNRLLGILFSVVKCVIILSLVTFLINYLDKAWNIFPDSMFSGSALYPYLTELSEKIFPYLKEILS